ncbi:MAG: hypothetical protein ABSG90_08215 [Dehalococcoidia bacterium]
MSRRILSIHAREQDASEGHQGYQKDRVKRFHIDKYSKTIRVSLNSIDLALCIVKVAFHQPFVRALSTAGITTFGKENHTAGYFNTGLIAVHSRVARGHNDDITNKEDAMDTMKTFKEMLKTDGKLRLLLGGMVVDGTLLLAVIIALGVALAI